MDCIFCKIAKGEVPCHKVYEDDEFLAFLDVFPNTEGMTLVIPKKHFDSYVIDMPDKEYLGLLMAAKKVGKLLEKKLNVKRVAIVMEGMGVDHVHIKLYPMHGLEQRFVEMFVGNKFFEIYPGYISTEMGPKADHEKLKKLAKRIRE